MQILQQLYCSIKALLLKSVVWTLHHSFSSTNKGFGYFFKSWLQTIYVLIYYCRHNISICDKTINKMFLGFALINPVNQSSNKFSFGL